MTALLLLSPETYAGPRIAALPGVLRTAPEGLGWFFRVLPVNPAFATVVQWMLVGSAALGLVCFRTRTALAVTALSGLYVLFLFIPFTSLWGCYTMLVDFGRLSPFGAGRRARAVLDDAPGGRRSWLKDGRFEKSASGSRVVQ